MLFTTSVDTSVAALQAWGPANGIAELALKAALETCPGDTEPGSNGAELAA